MDNISPETAVGEENERENAPAEGSREAAPAETVGKSEETEAAVLEPLEKIEEAETAAEPKSEAAAEPAAEAEAKEPAEPQAEAEPFRARRGFRYGCYRFVKRTFDIVSSGLFLLLFCWLYLILAIVVKCSDGGSVFYKHRRVGKNGKEIFLPKFRSMRKDADKLEDWLTPEQLEQYKREYKIDNDPRITKVGKFLRKTSLDELPNIWAIFKGDISVIGPRPLMRSELEEKYGKDAQKLVSMRPGMIGWWAANGRSNCTYESGERQKLELYYIDHCSIWLDIKIIFKTIVSVFKHTGAQ